MLLKKLLMTGNGKCNYFNDDQDLKNYHSQNKDILEKEFKIDTRGYRLKEVDQFLDIIIGDYEQFFNIIMITQYVVNLI